MTLCLNMIVKNESHIIIDTLTKLISKIKFDYYVICDTGSDDNTIDLIKYFFKDLIPGEIHIHEWMDFGYNRSLALHAAFGKTDYLLIFDADDYIEGEIILPNLILDSYMLNFGNIGNAYERMCLVKNNIIWKYIGVLHEYISTENQITTGHIIGNYFVVSGRTSSRNNDSQKYIKDAEILEKGYHESLKNGDNLFNRYVYYCANSYLDAGIKDKAIEWYNLTLKSNGWFDERYNSCLKLYDLTNNKDYLIQSFHHNPQRVEGIFYLIRHYTCEEMYSIAMGYYKFIKEYYENEYLTDNLSRFLFANVMDYTFYLPYFMIIVCEKLRDYSTGLKMFEIIFEKMTTAGQWWSDNLIFNLQFFDHNKLKKLNEYIKFLEKGGIKVNYTYLKKLNEKGENHKFDILFYTGFAKCPWNYTYSLNNAMGGSEKAVIYLSHLFPKELKIVISGDIEDEVIDNIHYINRFKINDSYEFKTIIISRYVSFFTIYPYLLDCKNIILMAHDTHFMNNLQGCDKSANEIISKNKINSIVYLTDWQKTHYENVTHPECKNIKSVVINNGIQLDLFPLKNLKIPNTFMYTSGSFRGLLRLLQLWPSILKKIPDAMLLICSYEKFPKNNDDIVMNEIIKNHSSIKHLGKLKTEDLYNLMNNSEYWLYPCSFNETSCITSLEMLMSEVICLYYPIAGLTDTLGNYGIQVKEGNEVETIINLTLEDKIKLRNDGKKYAKSCSWENRVIEWSKLIKKRILFYGRDVFPKIVLDDYFNSLKSKYEIDYTTEIKESDYTYYDELIYVHETYNKQYAVYDSSIIEKFKEINYLNTEPLNLECRLLYIQQNVSIFPEMKIYDYSMGNIKIMKESGIKNEIIYFPYLLNEEENIFLKEQKEKNEKLSEFGIMCSAGVITNDLLLLNPPRRKQVVEYLISQGFTVNIISGFGKERDTALSKCKVILNIHGQYGDEPTNIFEHIRCNRLLNAGYKILSEESYFMDPSFSKYQTLEFIKFDDFFKITKQQDYSPKVSYYSPNVSYYSPKVIDCFTFYNEIDMLTHRLETLYNVVDYFILVEATLTHVGKPKEMYYSKELFKKYSDKIIHIVVDDFSFNENNINCLKNEQWLNEKFQRNCITRGFSKLDLDNNDLIIISDVDEIPNPTTLKLIKNGEIKINNISQFEQDFYYYNIESKMDHLWYFSKIFRYGWFLTTDFTLDDLRMKWFENISNGGWHLSYFGTPSFISNKIKNFAHQEFNSDTFTKEESIEQRIKNGVDIYDRNIQIIKLNVKLNTFLPPNYNLVYCFIHSCNLNQLNRLEYLIDKINDCEINFKTIFINNIGKPLEKRFEGFQIGNINPQSLIVDNYSDNPLLFEIPTINKMIQFSKKHPYDNILYLHTKGVAHSNDYQELNDWINLMLHFLLKKSNKELLNTHDCIGCNYKDEPLPHYSGNFWWANCKYLSTLLEIPEFNINKNDAEYHLFKNKPVYHSLHNSTVNHYHQCYPKDNYH